MAGRLVDVPIKHTPGGALVIFWGAFHDGHGKHAEHCVRHHQRVAELHRKLELEKASSAHSH